MLEDSTAVSELNSSVQPGAASLLPIDIEDRLGGKWFASAFAGEHASGAGLAFAVLSVQHGAGAIDVAAGLAIGALLAVLSWAFVCAPIAARARQTLYEHLRSVIGPGAAGFYNLANASFFGILAGTMLAFAASAINIPFRADPNAIDAIPRNTLDWIATTILIGLAASGVAMMGFKRICQFSALCWPWIYVVLFCAAIAILPQWGRIHNFSDFWQIASTQIWSGVPKQGYEKYGMLHVAGFAWSYNLILHAGLSDMAYLRYAKRWTYGFYSAFAMGLGHFLGWISLGILAAAYGLNLEPGLQAFNAAGLAGALALAIAGWIAANYAIYRAGLALQCLLPTAPLRAATALASVAAIVLAALPLPAVDLSVFPIVFGLILLPVGAIVFAEHWVFPLLGLQSFWVEERKQWFNLPALITWILVLVFCWLPMRWVGIHLYFRLLPVWLLSIVLYCAFCVLWNVQKTSRPGGES